ncbi:MAG: hypothetical protein RSG50_11315, partial [Clostridia bacterium]
PFGRGNHLNQRNFMRRNAVTTPDSADLAARHKANGSGFPVLPQKEKAKKKKSFHLLFLGYLFRGLSPACGFSAQREIPPSGFLSPDRFLRNCLVF